MSINDNMHSKFKNLTFKAKFGTYLECYLKVDRYITKDKLRVDVVSRTEGTILSLTTNLTEVPLDINQCCLDKSFCSQEDILYLKELGIIDKVLFSVDSGFCKYLVAQFSDDFMKYANSRL